MQVIAFAFYVLLFLTGSPAASVPAPSTNQEGERGGEGALSDRSDSTSPPVQISPAPPGGVSKWEAEVAPIFATRCQPCHFTGGVMHDKLPFDDPATIRKLGKKTFSRIRDEKERALITAFLAEKKNAGDR